MIHKCYTKIYLKDYIYECDLVCLQLSGLEFPFHKRLIQC